ncbi:MAG: MBL fold metallo-hydrolase [Lachnospiraceae bacterium]|nr:MBL fold metallo-hydrolase [Lachnospiraceae bacterium]
MQVTYIHHSGFLVETEVCYFLFDYHRGELPPLKPGKPVCVFISHRHPDHCNLRIFSILRERNTEHITAVLSKDILTAGRKDDRQEVLRQIQGAELLSVTFHQEYHPLPGITVKTLLSTDEGVAFLLTCSEGTVYHAGDLNDWVWEEETEQYNRQMTGSYRHEIDLLKGTKIDIAFLPLDPRQEKDYARGILYFLKHIPVQKVYPMHYWEQPAIIRQFLAQYPAYEGIVQMTESHKQEEQ